MLNKKRLKNLSLLKQKKLLNQKIEISTLDSEYQKNIKNKNKWKDILDKTLINSTEYAFDIREKSKFKLKLSEQIYISENREKFLNIELKRAKKNLGKMIKEKEIIDEKIKVIAQLDKNKLEKRFLDSMPPKKNTWWHYYCKVFWIVWEIWKVS